MKTLLYIYLVLVIQVFSIEGRSDGDMYALTSSDQAFFERMRKAVLDDDTERVANALAYPFDARLEKGKIKLKTAKDFKKHAKIILNERLKSILRKQSIKTLFKNWQGIMVGDGEIWFSEVEENTNKASKDSWVYRITAINLDATRNR